MTEKGKGIRDYWNRIPQWLRELARDAGIALGVVGTILLALYLILGVWPPMVVVESGSMEHDPSHSSVGVIDTGDLVFIKDVDSVYDVTTYIEGRAEGRSTFGDFGDVIVYRKWGSEEYTPVIHRAFAFVEYDDGNHTFAVRHLSKLTEGQDFTIEGPGSPASMTSGSRLTIHNVGFNLKEVTINFQILLNASDVHSGFITMGDWNCGGYNVPLIDQQSSIMEWGGETIHISWVIGRGVVELPWFGLIKLTIQRYPAGAGFPDAASNSYWNLGIALAVIVAVPFLLDFTVGWAVGFIRRKRGKDGKKEGGGQEEGGAPGLKGGTEGAGSAKEKAEEGAETGPEGGGGGGA